MRDSSSINVSRSVHQEGVIKTHIFPVNVFGVELAQAAPTKLFNHNRQSEGVE